MNRSGLDPPCWKPCSKPLLKMGEFSRETSSEKIKKDPGLWPRPSSLIRLRLLMLPATLLLGYASQILPTTQTSPPDYSLQTPPTFPTGQTTHNTAFRIQTTRQQPSIRTPLQTICFWGILPPDQTFRQYCFQAQYDAHLLLPHRRAFRTTRYDAHLLRAYRTQQIAAHQFALQAPDSTPHTSSFPSTILLFRNPALHCTTHISTFLSVPNRSPHTSTFPPVTYSTTHTSPVSLSDTVRRTLPFGHCQTQCTAHQLPLG